MNSSSNPFDNRSRPYEQIPLLTSPSQKDNVKLDSFSALRNAPESVITSKKQPIERNGSWIEVSNPVTRDYNLSKHIVYTIRGNDELGSFESLQRYSTFLTLRQVLRSRWPGVYIPSLPEKKMIGNLEPEFIKNRQNALENFLIGIQGLPYLYNSEEVQFFLRSQQPDTKTGLLLLPVPNHDDIVKKYASVFGHMSELELTKEVTLKIENFQTYLTKINEAFKAYKSITEGLAQVKREYHHRLGMFHNNVLMDYEQQCLTEYSKGSQTPNVFLRDSNSDPALEMTKIKEAASKKSFDAFYNLLKSENQDIEAFLEIIKTRDLYQALRYRLQDKIKSDTMEKQNVLAGKMTLKRILSRRSRDQYAIDIDRDIKINEKNVENVTILLDMMTLIIAHVEIDKFRKGKVENYLKITKQMCVNEQQLSHHTNSFWTGCADAEALKRVASPNEEEILVSENK